jgi:Ethanolamine utilization protein EutJ (predicted chaperonin)
MNYFRATDDGGAVGTATVVITVSDVNEATPTFGATSYTVCVPDGLVAGNSVLYKHKHLYLAIL